MRAHGRQGQAASGQKHLKQQRAIRTACLASLLIRATKARGLGRPARRCGSPLRKQHLRQPLPAGEDQPGDPVTVIHTISSAVPQPLLRIWLPSCSVLAQRVPSPSHWKASASFWGFQRQRAQEPRSKLKWTLQREKISTFALIVSMEHVAVSINRLRM